MSSWEACRAVERNPAKVNGAWVFANTRVPVRALFENLEDGATVDQFVEWFPGVGIHSAAYLFNLVRRRPELLAIKPDSPIEMTTDGKVLMIRPVSLANRAARVAESLSKINAKHGKALAKLAE